MDKKGRPPENGQEKGLAGTGEKRFNTGEKKTEEGCDKEPPKYKTSMKQDVRYQGQSKNRPGWEKQPLE